MRDVESLCWGIEVESVGRVKSVSVLGMPIAGVTSCEEANCEKAGQIAAYLMRLFVVNIVANYFVNSELGS